MVHEGRKVREGYTAREDDEQQAGQKKHGLHYGHALLEDDLVSEEVQTGAESNDLAVGLLALAFQCDDGGLPDLVVLLADGAQLGEDGLIEVVKE